MKTISLMLCGIFTIAQGRTIDSNALYKPRIINGEEAKLGERPFQVSLQSSGYHVCGGSIVNEHWVVTAAHCVEGEQLSSISLAAGTINLEQPYSTHQAEQIIMHEKFDDSLRNDIALIKVATPFQFSDRVQPVALPEFHSKVQSNSTAVVSGWGYLIDWAESDKLQKVSIYITDQENCTKIMKKKGLKIYPTQVCAHDPSIKRGSCNGDSGGPLTVDNVLTGIVSWAIKNPDCVSTEYPGVYTRVSEYVDWINQHVQ